MAIRTREALFNFKGLQEYMHEHDKIVTRALHVSKQALNTLTVRPLGTVPVCSAHSQSCANLFEYFPPTGLKAFTVMKHGQPWFL